MQLLKAWLNVQLRRKVLTAQIVRRKQQKETATNLNWLQKKKAAVEKVKEKDAALVENALAVDTVVAVDRAEAELKQAEVLKNLHRRFDNLNLLNNKRLPGC
jgi:hypothetical protein